MLLFSPQAKKWLMPCGRWLFHRSCLWPALGMDCFAPYTEALMFPSHSRETQASLYFLALISELGRSRRVSPTNARWYFKSTYPPRCKTLVSVLIQWLYFQYWRLDAVPHLRFELEWGDREGLWMWLSCSVSLYKTSGWLPGAQQGQSQCKPCSLDAWVLAFALVNKARCVHLGRLREELHGPARIHTDASW